MKQIRALLELDCFKRELQDMGASSANINGVVYWLQNEAGRVVAAANINADSNLGGMVLWNVCVASDMRGKGIGEQLLNYILTHWPRHPAFAQTDGELYLYVDVRNERAISLYLKYGFEIVDETQASGMKVYVMRVRLN